MRSICACLDLSVSSSSWGLGRAAVCDCGTPWTFFLPFFTYRPFRRTLISRIIYEVHSSIPKLFSVQILILAKRAVEAGSLHMRVTVCKLCSVTHEVAQCFCAPRIHIQRDIFFYIFLQLFLKTKRTAWQRYYFVANHSSWNHFCFKNCQCYFMFSIILNRVGPASILRKSTSGRYRPVSYPDGPMTARYRFT